jgi:hypothetical protein
MRKGGIHAEGETHYLRFLQEKASFAEVPLGRIWVLYVMDRQDAGSTGRTTLATVSGTGNSRPFEDGFTHPLLDCQARTAFKSDPQHLA